MAVAVEGLEGGGHQKSSGEAGAGWGEEQRRPGDMAALGLIVVSGSGQGYDARPRRRRRLRGDGAAAATMLPVMDRAASPASPRRAPGQPPPFTAGVLLLLRRHIDSVPRCSLPAASAVSSLRVRAKSERKEREIEKEKGGRERLTWPADMWGPHGSHADSAATSNKTGLKTAEGPPVSGFVKLGDLGCLVLRFKDVFVSR
uniref:Uncharacterized protein n=1 Tax=Oryza glumipatula TaxID=40148 RepID=A0A0D9YA59_9ORYZ